MLYFVAKPCNQLKICEYLTAVSWSVIQVQRTLFVSLGTFDVGNYNLRKNIHTLNLNKYTRISIVSWLDTNG